MNAAWGGQWDRGEIMISMGALVFTDFPMTMECRIKEKMDLITYEPMMAFLLSLALYVSLKEKASDLATLVFSRILVELSSPEQT